MKYEVLETFKIKTSRGEMELKPGQIIILSPQKASLLLNRNKIKLKIENTTDDLKDLFMETVQNINKRYISGTIGYIKKYHPDLYNRTHETQDKIDEIWKACPRGEASIEEFQEALNNWYHLNLQGIEIYAKKRKNLNKA